MTDINLYQEMNDKIADLLLGCEDNGMCLYAGAYIKSLEEQIKSYKDLEEQGKLLKLPCAVGDTVWFIKSCFSFMSKAKAEKVRKIEIILGEIIFITENRRFDIGSVGKTVFLTREEAEATLKELEGREE